MKNNFYSHDEPETAEQFFQVFEQGLKEDVQAALSVSVSEPSRNRDLLGVLLLTQALTAFVRNPVHVNERLDDQFNAILQAGEQLRRRLLLGWDERESSEDFLVRATGIDRRWIPPDERERNRLFAQIVADRWLWTVLRTPPGSSLLMSDTPVRLFQMPWGGVVWIWPLTSTALFVATTRGDSEIRERRLTIAEVTAVNEIIVSRAFSWAISANEIPKDQLQRIARLWEVNEPLTSRLRSDGWYEAIPKLSKNPLTFVQPRLGSDAVWKSPST